LQLGLGSGWQEREHNMFGYSLLSLQPRFNRFREGLEVITQLMISDQPVNFTGDYYQLREAILLPKSKRVASPSIIIGGNGVKYTLPLVARYAHEWNCVALPPSRFAERNAQLDLLLTQEGRRPEEVRRSMMTNLIFARDENLLQRKLKGRSQDELVSAGRIAGTPAQIAAQLGQYSTVGLQRVMLQWLDLDDLDGLEELARTVLPLV
jgi:alkanesulfonate monooxygenase SsuD/methylene tetrahydromethanopterin reductase-like flavin-dependent oxidoreductase (luciferase family)